MTQDSEIATLTRVSLLLDIPARGRNDHVEVNLSGS